MGSDRLGIIGYGNMGSAIVRGLNDAGIYEARNISVFDVDSEKCLAAQEEGCTVAESLSETGTTAETILVAVKPGWICDVVDELGKISSGSLIISVAAGINLAALELAAPNNPVIRVMPNTPCMVGAGASALARGSKAGDNHAGKAMEIMGALGYVCEVPEKLMNAVTGLSGSGPAYVALVIDAMTDGGVKMGLPRPLAQRLAAQTVFGAAKMIIDRDISPAALRDMVTSPGGTTIEGISILESRAFRSALIDAVEAAAWKSEELS